VLPALGLAGVVRNTRLITHSDATRMMALKLFCLLAFILVGLITDGLV